ncbi:MAG: thioredoxin family protein [Gracilimonas sp.]|uniref:thioredoxin domain-containing protein n=1 Tax=Gracilimonas sp. TaxID=1974203 RepID=UPI003752BB62|nr:thioredoxin family protein [Gracilimonas sp.]
MSEDTIQKREILMNSARLMILSVIILFGVMIIPATAQSTANQVGPVTAEEITDHDRIFSIYVDRYDPDREAIEYLSSQEDSLVLYIFFGNWCRESKKYIPGLIKTLKMLDSDLIEVTYIGVDEQKKYPESFLNKFDIKYIPTVVVLKGGFEIGRIEEKPQRPIESDLVQILKRHKGQSN